MSFWPFGPQSPRKSDIYYIVNDYFDLLRRLDALDNYVVPFGDISTNSSAINSNSNADMKSVLLHDTDNDRITPIVTRNMKSDNISILQSNNISGGDDDGDDEVGDEEDHGDDAGVGDGESAGHLDEPFLTKIGLCL